MLHAGLEEAEGRFREGALVRCEGLHGGQCGQSWERNGDGWGGCGLRWGTPSSVRAYSPGPGVGASFSV